MSDGGFSKRLKQSAILGARLIREDREREELDAIKQPVAQLLIKSEKEITYLGSRTEESSVKTCGDYDREEYHQQLAEDYKEYEAEGVEPLDTSVQDLLVKTHSRFASLEVGRQARREVHPFGSIIDWECA